MIQKNVPRAYAAAVLCVALMLPAGCGSAGTSAAWEPCASPGVEPFARLSTSGGIAGRNDTMAVRCDGTVERNGEITAQDEARVATLIARLRESGVLALPDEAFTPDRQCNDCFLYELELIENGAIRRWSAVETVVPEPLGAAIDALREADTAP